MNATAFKVWIAFVCMVIPGQGTAAIVAPVVSVLLVLGLLVGILIWYFKCYRKADEMEVDAEDKGRFSS